MKFTGLLAALFALLSCSPTANETPETRPTSTAAQLAAGTTLARRSTITSRQPIVTAPPATLNLLPTLSPLASKTPVEAKEAVINGHAFVLVLALTSDQHFRGLAGREELAVDAGMLFVYRNMATLSFWMKDTVIPLDILFIDEDRRIVDIHTMLPQPGLRASELTRYKSRSPAMYALEINGGLAETLGFEVGMMVGFR